MARLFICDNGFTCLMAMIMKVQMFNNDEADIVLTNRTSGAEERVNRINEVKLFRNAYYGDTYSCHHGLSKVIHYEKQMKCFMGGCDLELLNVLPYDYSDIYCLYFNCLTNIISIKLQKLGIKPSIHLMEEGYGTYTNHYARLAFNYNKGRKCAEALSGVIYNHKQTRSFVTDINLFETDMMMWTPPCPVKKIDKPDFDKFPELKAQINYVFSYNNASSEYSGKKVIFFEDSLFQDKGDNSDFPIINRIGEIVGREQFIVKLHPRTKINRFIDLYDTNTIQGIPWEVVAMNLPDDKELLFVTMTSGSVVGPGLLFGKKFKSIILFDCVKNFDSHISPELLEWLRQYAAVHPEYLMVPNDLRAVYSEIELASQEHS